MVFGRGYIIGQMELFGRKLVHSNGYGWYWLILWTGKLFVSFIQSNISSDSILKFWSYSWLILERFSKTNQATPNYSCKSLIPSSPTMKQTLIPITKPFPIRKSMADTIKCHRPIMQEEHIAIPGGGAGPMWSTTNGLETVSNQVGSSVGFHSEHQGMR